LYITPFATPVDPLVNAIAATSSPPKAGSIAEPHDTSRAGPPAAAAGVRDARCALPRASTESSVRPPQPLG
jgi:hypothetical protein